MEFYVVNGRLCDVQKVFDEMFLRGISLCVFLWNDFFYGFVVKKQLREVFDLFLRMLSENVVFNEFIFVNVLKVCGGDVGKKVGFYFIQQIYVKMI